MKKFEEDALVLNLGTLAVQSQIAFAAACCERMFPLYEAFSEMESWGRPDLMRSALDFLWAAAESGATEEATAREMLASCESLAPDSDDFSSVFTGGAQRAANGVAYALEAYVNPNAETVALVGRLATEVIEEYITQTCFLVGAEQADYAPFLRWVESSPLMQAELNAQEADMGTLRAASMPNATIIREMQERSRRQGVQPFTRGIVTRRA